MNLEDLRSVVEVAQCGSISAAAKKLAMAQPNLSRLIRDLEQEYGITIFARIHRGVVPTVEGTVFLQQARHIVAEMDTLKTSCAPESKKLSGISLSVPRASYISDSFSEYLTTLDINSIGIIRYNECSSLNALRNIRECGYGMAIIRYAIEDEDYYLALAKLERLCLTPLNEFTCRLLVSSKSPLAEAASITEKHLEKYLEIRHGDELLPGSNWQHEHFSEKKDMKLEKKVFVTERGGQFDLLARIPDSYMWVSPMPERLLSTLDMKQLIPDSPKILMRDALVFSESHVFTAEEKNFLSLLLRNITNDFDRIFSKAFPLQP